MKERKTFSLDDNVARYLEQPQINGSGLVNELVKRYMRDEMEL
jgi:hypothetical protein